MTTDLQLVHGTLKFGDMCSLGECDVRLIIDSGDVTKDGKPFIKEYTGKLVFSTNGVMFCNLISNIFGDMWFLVFNHSNLNNTDLQCIIGCAATSSSGIHRHPAIHNFCLCNKQKYPTIIDEMKEHIRGLLRIKNDKILISEKKLSQFLAQANLDENFKNNINTAIKTSEKYYVIPRENLRPNVNTGVLAKTMAELCDKSDLPHVFHSLDYDDTQLQLVLGAPADNQNNTQ